MPPRLTEAVVLVESLPLTTSEFSVATNRLNNAHRCLESNERGAAMEQWNLRLGRYEYPL